MQKVRCISTPYQNEYKGNKDYIEKDGIYTIECFRLKNTQFKIVEGSHNHFGGWWYDRDDFKFVITEINKNIRVL